MNNTETPETKNEFISILIVDNEFAMRLGHKRQIKKVELKTPVQIFEASSIDEAKQILSVRAIDLLLLDHNLGEDENGNEQLGVEAIPSFLKIQRALKIIVVTGNDGEDLKRQALAFGAAEFVVKGNPEHIRDAIATALGSIENRIPHGMGSASNSKILARPEAIYLKQIYTQLSLARSAGAIRQISFSNRSMRPDDESEGYFFEAVSRSGVGSAFSADYYMKDYGVREGTSFIAEHMNNVRSNDPDFVARLLTAVCRPSLGENSLYSRLLSSAFQIANVTSFNFPYSTEGRTRGGKFYVFSLEGKNLVQTELDFKECVKKFGERNRQEVLGMQIGIHQDNPRAITFNFEKASCFLSEKFQPHMPEGSSSGPANFLTETDSGLACNFGFAAILESYAKSRPENLKLLWNLVSGVFPKGTPFSFEFRQEKGRLPVKLTLGKEFPLAAVIAAVDGSAEEAGLSLE